MQGNHDGEDPTRLGGKGPPRCQCLTLSLLTCIASHRMASSVPNPDKVFSSSSTECISRSQSQRSPLSLMSVCLLTGLRVVNSQSESCIPVLDIFLKTILSTWTADSSAATVQAASITLSSRQQQQPRRQDFNNTTYRAGSWKFPSLSIEPVLPHHSR